MNNVFKNFGDFIAKKRVEKAITLREMAKKLEISAPYLSDIENDRRNPFELEKLEQLANILLLSEEDRTIMFDLAGEKRDEVAPDLPDYIKDREYVSAALRTARDLDAGEKEWLEFVNELKRRKG
jgi:transcriptional regulator with XRE-family HTH domain